MPNPQPTPDDATDPMHQDLGPLAWVMDDVRRCLSGAVALVRSAAGAPAEAEAAVRPLRQAAGALDMVGQPAAARVVGAMAQAVANSAGQAAVPEALPEALERAGFAVAEFLDLLLQGRPVHAVSLHPQWRAVLALAGVARTPHPSDLWQPPLATAQRMDEALAADAAWPAVVLPAPEGAGGFSRARFDAAVLRMVRAGDAVAARELSDLSACLAADDTAAGDPAVRGLWPLAAAYFDFLACEPGRIDLLARRMASRVLLAYAQASRPVAAAGAPGAATVSGASGAPGADTDRLQLLHDLLFGCALAGPVDAARAPRLAAVREAWGLTDHPALDYDTAPFGRYDPALLAVLRKRLVAAREGWAEIAGGDVRHLRSTADHFGQLAEGLTRLHGPLAPLAQALVDAVDQVTAAPTPAVAMEVATAILFLEALCQAFDPTDATLEARALRLAERLGRVQRSAPPEPLEPWIEALYRQASDRQTLGSVVDELRSALAGLEKDLDAFFRDQADPASLQAVPGRLTQMRGVLSVLGLDLAARATLRMRDQVQSLWTAPDHPDAATWIESLGRNLGALGFLIDMLHYQPALARQLFVFDEVLGELQPVMGRAAQARESLRQVELPTFAPTVPAAPAESETAQPVGTLQLSPELLNVFLDEADEGSLRLQALLADWGRGPAAAVVAEAEALAHSLAGSAATVGFTGLAEVARGVEQVLRQQGAWPERAALLAGPAWQPLSDAGDHIRHLLHQFAAGFVREADPALIQALDGLSAQLAAVPEPVVEDRPDLPRAEPMEVVEVVEAVGGVDGVEPAGALNAPEVPEAPEASAALEVIDLIESTEAPAPAPASALAPDQPDPGVFPLFEEEALELLPQLDAVLRQWSAHPADGAGARRDAVLRLLHTLKGGARLAGLSRLGEGFHAAESLAEALDVDAVPPGALDGLIQQVDALQAGFEALRLVAPSAAEPVPAPPVPVADPVVVEPPIPPAPSPVALRPVAPLPPLPVPAAQPPAPPGGLVRVRADLLDRLMNQTGEVMIAGARLETELRGLRGGLQDLSANLERLRAQLRDVEMQAETQMQSRQSRHAPAGDAAGFDPLEFDRFTRMQELTRMMAESVNDIATLQRQMQRAVDATEDDLAAQSRQTRELQRDLLRTRMQAFGSVAERLHRTVRQAAKDTGKPVRLTLEGGAIEVDRGILDRMVPAFEHLLRNAVAHGIEAPAQRAAAGKPEAGQLRILVEHAGNDIALRFEDDGAGLDLDRILAEARERGWVAPQAEVSAQEAAEFIFRPGFSTAGRLTELSGRGVGLDVVRAEVQALGGRIEVDSTPGAGTCFRLVLPLTTAVTHVVMMRCGALRFGVPASLVESVLRAEALALAPAQAAGQWTHEGQALPFFWAGALLRVARESEEAAGRPVPVVLLQSAAQRMALQVDEVLGHREVVVKHLGAQLARLPGLAGMTVLASGEVVLVYNPVALAAVYGERARRFAAGDDGQEEGLDAGPEEGAAGPAGTPVSGASAHAGAAAGTATAAHAQPPAAAPAEAALVLVVDDSLTVRRVTQRLLQREGFRVALAADGLQALERLAQETPAVVLSDIEMPRMDGFELARHVRSDPRWARLPLVFITSRIAAKHREHAQALGVNDYLGKPYSEEDLLARVRRYAGLPQAEAAGFLTTA